jgi:hypothetical protein
MPLWPFEKNVVISWHLKFLRENPRLQYTEILGRQKKSEELKQKPDCFAIA